MNGVPVIYYKNAKFFSPFPSFSCLFLNNIPIFPYRLKEFQKSFDKFSVNKFM